MSNNAFVRKAWKEYFSQKHQRYYYCNSENGDNTWFMPEVLQEAESLLDVDLFGVTTLQSSSFLKSLLLLCNEHWSQPSKLWDAISVMHKVISNIADCSNQVEKYRRIKKSNAKFAETVGALQGGEGVLTAAGFKSDADAVVFPDGGDIKLLAMANSRLAQLSERKGFMGAAILVDDTKQTSSSRHSGTPGFRYQKEIFECSVCSRPINDGTDRLITKLHDAPRGEFRYQCEVCSGFHLCEGCWERFQEKQAALHERSHPFRAVHPHHSLHGLYSQETANNPWGMPVSGASAARARERLRNRTGM